MTHPKSINRVNHLIPRTTHTQPKKNSQKDKESKTPYYSNNNLQSNRNTSNTANNNHSSKRVCLPIRPNRMSCWLR